MFELRRRSGAFLGRSVAMAYLLPLTFAACLNATTFTIDFNVAPPAGGSIDYSVANGPLVGSGIGVASVASLGTPLNDLASRDCIGCVLNFQTGDFIGSAAVGSLQLWYFAPGGSISIVGGVDLNNNGIIDGSDAGPADQLLLGEFTDTTIVEQINPTTFRVAVAGFTDEKDDVLTSFFGLPGGAGTTYSGNLNLSFLVTNSGDPWPGTFLSASVGSGDLLNQTPEPLTALLAGLGLLALGSLHFRRRSQA